MPKFCIWLMYFVIGYYNAVDVYLTKIIMDFGVEEGNPFLIHMIEKTDCTYTGIIGTKLFFYLWLGAALYYQLYIVPKKAKKLSLKKAKVGALINRNYLKKVFDQ